MGGAVGVVTISGSAVGLGGRVVSDSHAVAGYLALSEAHCMMLRAGPAGGQAHFAPPEGFEPSHTV
jgi:hypothetical protein